MNNKGDLSTIQWIIIGLIIITLMIVFTRPLHGQDNLFAKTSDFMKGLVPGFGGSGSGGFSRQCDDPSSDNVNDNQQLIRTIANQNPTVPESLLLAIADVESGFEHCSGGNLKTSGSSYGIMQIYPSTGEEICPNLDMSDREDNVVCGKLVLLEKHRLVQSDTWYETTVDNTCKNPTYQQKYKSYSAKSWKRALRAYNGLGCSTGADVDYVEKVSAAMSKY